MRWFGRKKTIVDVGEDYDRKVVVTHGLATSHVVVGVYSHEAGMQQDLMVWHEVTSPDEVTVWVKPGGWTVLVTSPDAKFKQDVLI
jgi:hypothetical protein